eukprot:934405-Rhodomonas_salina.2
MARCETRGPSAVAGARRMVALHADTGRESGYGTLNAQRTRTTLRNQRREITCSVQNVLETCDLPLIRRAVLQCSSAPADVCLVRAAMCLRARYAMSGTVCTPSHAMSGTDRGMLLQFRSGGMMTSTEVEYAAVADSAA